jgi:RNA polymerase sigma-70 factor, ECF subfamily
MGTHPTVETPVDDAPDHAVIADVLDGRRSRFGILVRRYNQRLFRAARAILGDPTEAEDVVQHAWMSAYGGLASFRGEASFATWVTRIAVHEALARQRLRARTVPVADTDVRDEDDPEHQATMRELGQVLERHLDALGDGLRAVIVMRDLLELDTAEVAASLGISEEAVRVRLHRGRVALHRSLAAVADLGLSKAYRFAGAQCDRVWGAVMAAIGASEPDTCRSATSRGTRMDAPG